jgi:hypothetical protein
MFQIIIPVVIAGEVIVAAEVAAGSVGWVLWLLILSLSKKSVTRKNSKVIMNAQLFYSMKFDFKKEQ